MATQIKQRRDTAANWTSVNPVLAQGEPALETDTGLEKVGDGATAWATLKYRAPLVSPIQAAKTADYSFTLADALAGKSIIANKATAIAFTILPQGTGGGQVAWQSENVLRGFNRNDGLLTLTPGAGVTFIGSVLTFAKGTGFTAARTASNEWVVLPFSAGASAPTVSGTTGSPTTSAVTVGGVTGTLYDFGANGSITLSRAGKALVCIIGGANADNGSYYGNAGTVFYGWIDLTAATHTIVVGASATGANEGGHSYIGSIVSAPGAFKPLSTTEGRGAGRGFSGANLYDGYPVDITGSSVTYGKTQPTTNTATEYGSSYPGSVRAGRVFIFIPD